MGKCTPWHSRKPKSMQSHPLGFTPEKSSAPNHLNKATVAEPCLKVEQSTEHFCSGPLNRCLKRRPLKEEIEAIRRLAQIGSDVSQKVVVVEELGVLPSFPQAEETEVKVHLDHLLTWGERDRERERRRTR